MPFEYMVALCPVDQTQLTPEGFPMVTMNVLGADEWELIGVLPTRSSDVAAGFFKRVGTGPLPPTPPVLTSLEPNTAELGQPDFTLRVLGTGFTPQSILVANGTDVATIYVSETELSHLVALASAAAGTVQIAARTDVMISNVLPFTVTTPPPPVTTSLVPNTAELLSANFTLQVLGTGFTPASVIAANGVDVTTTYVSPTELTHAVNMANATVEGPVQITVRNGAVVSNALPFTLTTPVPVLTSVTPATLPVSISQPPWLNIHGTGFLPDAIPYVTGAGKMGSEYISPTQVNVLIDSQLAPNTITLEVANTPGGTRSNPLMVPVEYATPVLTSISPNTLSVGAATTSLTVTGTGFMLDSVVFVNNVAQTTMPSVPGTELTALLATVSTPGAVPVEVANQAGAGPRSNALTFTYMPPPVLTSLTPNTSLVSQGAQTVTVTGTGFLPDSVVHLGNAPQSTTYVSGTTVTYAMPAPVGAQTQQIDVRNGGGSPSNALPFTVTAG